MLRLLSLKFSTCSIQEILILLYSWHSCVVDEGLKYVPQSNADAIHGLAYVLNTLFR